MPTETQGAGDNTQKMGGMFWRFTMAIFWSWTAELARELGFYILLFMLIARDVVILSFH